ncbi:hypothetical protein D3227_33375 [Mesorhizobium waimense]|uniref:Uncharacterized protein n=1 Tax=Mesorhizobium waimense TaxID=1300307 RepID=A0A3A5K8K9_9HYPH|nr:hypothetical protein D3227_33375 [Mesorhizobium waimense]
MVCDDPEPKVVTRIVERKSDVPRSLFDCMPEPVATEVGETQRYVALYLERLALAGQDCRTRLAKVRKLLADR